MGTVIILWNHPVSLEIDIWNNFDVYVFQKEPENWSLMVLLQGTCDTLCGVYPTQLFDFN